MILARIVSWSSFDISCKAGPRLSFWHDPAARQRAEESLASRAVHKMVVPCCQVWVAVSWTIFGKALHGGGQTVVLAHLCAGQWADLQV